MNLTPYRRMSQSAFAGYDNYKIEIRPAQLSHSRREVRADMYGIRTVVDFILCSVSVLCVGASLNSLRRLRRHLPCIVNADGVTLHLSPACRPQIGRQTGEDCHRSTDDSPEGSRTPSPPLSKLARSMRTRAGNPFFNLHQLGQYLGLVNQRVTRIHKVETQA